MSTFVYFILIIIALTGLSITIFYLLEHVFNDKDVKDEIYNIILHTNVRLDNNLTVDEENYILWEAILEIEHAIRKK